MVDQRPKMVTNPFQWLDRIDPGLHRRIKGLRLVTAFGIASILGALHDVTTGLPDAASLGALAGGFALWASVSEGQATRRKSARDLVLLSLAATAGAVSFVELAPLLARFGHAGPELTLASGAFLVGYLRRFAILGTGLGSQVYIGQLYALSGGLGSGDLKTVLMAGAICAVAAVIPRVSAAQPSARRHSPRFTVILLPCAWGCRRQWPQRSSSCLTD